MEDPLLFSDKIYKEGGENFVRLETKEEESN